MWELAVEVSFINTHGLSRLQSKVQCVSSSLNGTKGNVVDGKFQACCL